MEKKYYLALFNYETWNEFIENGSSVYGTTSKKRARVEKTNPGDFLICYVTKISRFVGLLEITSKSYTDERRIWKNAVYPERIDVRPICILKSENGVPILNMKDELTLFSKFKSPTSWKGFFMNSFNTFQEPDAKIIVAKLSETIGQLRV